MNPLEELWKKDFSASKINSFLSCPRAWEQKYIYRRFDDPSIDAHLGKAFHAAIQYGIHSAVNYISFEPEKYKENALEELSNVASDYSQNLLKTVRESFQENFFNEDLNKIKNYEENKAKELFEYGNLMVGAYHPYLIKLIHEMVEKGYTPETEVNLKLRMGTDGKFKKYEELPGAGITTFIDLKISNKSFLDWKTANKTLAENDARTSLQFGLYTWALKMHDPWQSENYELEIHCIAKNKLPKVTVYKMTYTNQMLEYVERRVANILQAIKDTKVFYPQYGYLCKNYCSFKSDPDGCGYACFETEEIK